MSTSNAPQSSITPRTDQIHLTGFTSALRNPTPLLSAGQSTSRDTRVVARSGWAHGLPPIPLIMSSLFTPC